MRNYQIVETESSATDQLVEDENDKAKKKGKKDKSAKQEETNIKLVEIGPRFVLTPIVIQEGSFGGPIIYENKEFVSPNQVRSEVRKRKAGRYGERVERRRERGVKKGELGLRTDGERDGGRGGRRDELDSKVLFA